MGNPPPLPPDAQPTVQIAPEQLESLREASRPTEELDPAEVELLTSHPRTVRR